MEIWRDQGIVLAARPHGENGAVVSLLTEERGRHVGYIRGAHSTKMRGTLDSGNLVDASWQARAEGQLGTWSLELQKNGAVRLMDDPLKLAALQSACALSDAALPEREGHPGLFHGLLVLIDALETDIWGPAYVMWEIAFLKELGFSLDLSKCAGGGSPKTLMYVSPKTGRAVSAEKGEAYKDKLLILPDFLKGRESADADMDILNGLKLTAHFLEHWVFTHHSHGIPEARLRFQARFAKHVESDLEVKAVNE